MSMPRSRAPPTPSDIRLSFLLRRTTFGRQNSDRNSPSRVSFPRQNGLLADHPTTQGRESSVRVARVLSFAGQSLEGPPGSVALLELGDAALDRKVDAQGDSPDG